MAGLAASGALLAVILALWPYQHWDFDQRSSLLGGIVKKALQDSEWVFCLLVPFLVGWLVWRMRDELRPLPRRGSWAGLPFLLLGGGFYWVGYKADTAYPGYVAAQILILGLLLCLGGLRWVRALFFPWLFLAFMWPLPLLENSLSVPLRMQTAQMSAWLLNHMGVDVVREGTGLNSAGNAARGLAQGDLFRLDVEKPCSGIRSLSALLMISALYGWLSLRSLPGRAALFLSAIPLAVVGNLVRMILLALGSLAWGMDVAVGRVVEGEQEMSAYHTGAGFAVFAVALAGMAGLSWLLERWEKRRAARSQPARPQGTSKPATPAATASPHGTLLTLAAGLVLAAVLAVCALTDATYHVDAPGVRPGMPALLAGYVSEERPMTAQEQSGLKDDVRIERRLYTKPERAILATVVVSGAEKRSLHAPEVCLPAQGWVMRTQTTVMVPLEDGTELEATLISMHRDVEPQPGKRTRIHATNLYWYQGSAGATCATYEQHVFRTYMDGVFRNINHRWALMSFYTPLAEQPAGLEDPFAELAAVEDTKAFIRELLPHVLAR